MTGNNKFKRIAKNVGGGIGTHSFFDEGEMYKARTRKSSKYEPRE